MGLLEDAWTYLQSAQRECIIFICDDTVAGITGHDGVIASAYYSDTFNLMNGLVVP